MGSRKGTRRTTTRRMAVHNRAQTRRRRRGRNQGVQGRRARDHHTPTRGSAKGGGGESMERRSMGRARGERVQGFRRFSNAWSSASKCFGLGFGCLSRPVFGHLSHAVLILGWSDGLIMFVVSVHHQDWCFFFHSGHPLWTPLRSESESFQNFIFLIPHHYAA